MSDDSSFMSKFMRMANRHHRQAIERVAFYNRFVLTATQNKFNVRDLHDIFFEPSPLTTVFNLRQPEMDEKHPTGAPHGFKVKFVEKMLTAINQVFLAIFLQNLPF